MNIVDQIGHYLQGQMPKVNFSQGLMPPAPDRCIVVFAIDLNPNRDGGVRVQLRIRGDGSPSMALGDAEKAASLLDDFEGLLSAEGNYINRITVENGPAHLGADQNSRQEYSINLMVYYCD